MPAEPFSVRHYQVFIELPFERLHLLDYAIYIIDYDWKFLFLNHRAIGSLGKMRSQNARDLFTAAQYEPIYYRIDHCVSTKIALEAEADSPLRDQKLKLYGHALNDCYFFWTIPQPDKNQLMEELRVLLKRFSWNR